MIHVGAKHIPKINLQFSSKKKNEMVDLNASNSIFAGSVPLCFKETLALFNLRIDSFSCVFG